MTATDEKPPAHVRLGNRALVLIEDAVYVSIAVLLAVGAAILVGRAAFILAKGAVDTGPDAFIDTLDAILEAYIEEDASRDQLALAGLPSEAVERVFALVDRAEYKRRQAPPGIKITPRAFGRDRRMPITNAYRGG